MILKEDKKGNYFLSFKGIVRPEKREVNTAA